MIRPARAEDAPGLLMLLKEAAARPGGMARTPEEFTLDRVNYDLERPSQGGVAFVAEEGSHLLGFIHAASPGIGSLQHLLTDLTIAVHPTAQGKGVGRSLFQALLSHVIHQMPHIARVELFSRASNTVGLRLYASMGFLIEGRLRRRILDAEGALEDDVLMAWIRP